MSAARSTDDARERLGRQIGDVGNGVEAALVEFGRRDPSDAPQPFDGEGMEELDLGVGLDDEETVGFADGAGDLGEELGAGDADRDGQPDLVGDTRSETGGDDGRRSQRAATARRRR